MTRSDDAQSATLSANTILTTQNLMVFLNQQWSVCRIYLYLSAGAVAAILLSLSMESTSFQSLTLLDAIFVPTLLFSLFLIVQVFFKTLAHLGEESSLQHTGFVEDALASDTLPAGSFDPKALRAQIEDNRAFLEKMHADFSWSAALGIISMVFSIWGGLYR